MSLLSRIFGKNTSKDSRDILAKGEDWLEPETWYEDTDGKKVRRKKKKPCCGCTCEAAEVPSLPIIPAPLPFAEEIEEDEKIVIPQKLEVTYEHAVYESVFAHEAVSSPTTDSSTSDNSSPASDSCSGGDSGSCGCND